MTLPELLGNPCPLFVAGTDTGVGKTWVSCRLLEAWHRRGHRVGAMKPVACGDRLDAAALLEACNEPSLDLDTVNPCHLLMPAAPYAAGLVENRWPDPDLLARQAKGAAVGFDGFVVEGVGGWEVPFTDKILGSDFALDLGFPVLLVADNRLGALNHVILTVNAIRARGLKCTGVILNHVAEERDSATLMNRKILDEVLGKGTVLAEILHGEERLELAD